MSFFIPDCQEADIIRMTDAIWVRLNKSTIGNKIGGYQVRYWGFGDKKWQQ